MTTMASKEEGGRKVRLEDGGPREEGGEPYAIAKVRRSDMIFDMASGTPGTPWRGSVNAVTPY